MPADTPRSRADRPVIFSGPMVKALLREVEQPGEGKTMTRRLARDRRKDPADDKLTNVVKSTWQKVKAGDLLWVRESAARINNQDYGEFSYWEYRADTDGNCFAGDWPEEERDNPDRPRWKPSIHMPRWASRLTLEVTAVKIERLQDISEEDARAEGAPTFGRENARHAFAVLWNTLHGAGAWEANPEVVAISFRPHLTNIDTFTAARPAEDAQ